MIKTFNQICPVVNEATDVTIDYKELSSLGSSKISYIKGRYSCSNPNCPNQDCPIYNNAPKVF